MLTVYKKCFVCSVEIKKENLLLSPQESLFMSCEILGIPNWTDDLQRIKFETVCYCHECLNRILKIRYMLEELQKLEKDIFQEKIQIKSQLIESCTESDRNFIIGKDGERQPPGMLQILRKEIVTQLGRSSAQSMVRKTQKKVVARKTDEFPEETSINHQHSPFKKNQILRSTTRKIKVPELQQSLKYGISEKTLDDDSLLKNNTNKLHGNKSSTVAGGKHVTTTTLHNSKEVSRISKKLVLKQGNSSKSEIENPACPKPGKMNLECSFLKSYCPPSRRPKKCKKCGIVLSSSNSWREHMMYAHGAEPRFKCKLCSYSTGHSGHIARHMITHSKEKKNLKCDLCSKILRDKGALDRHMKIHGDKFQCKLCSCKFNYSSSLVRHETEAHKVDQNFKCELCFKTFKAYLHLHRHMNIHLRKFECKVCLITFNHKSSLRRHEIKTHEA